MSKLYNVDDVHAYFDRKIDRFECFLDAWGNVTFPTKKDGKPFANMCKNINGARYSEEEHRMQVGEMKLEVYVHTKKSGCQSDSINCYELVKYLKDDGKKNKVQNFMQKQPFLEQVYKYDLEDIKAAVQNRIEYLKKEIEIAKMQKENIEIAYNTFKKAYTEAVSELKKISGENQTLTMSIKDIVQR